MKKPKVTFIASEPPMPPTGGGNRTFHFVRAVAEVSNCSLFILFPIKTHTLPELISNKCLKIIAATKQFYSTSRSKLILLLHYFRLLFIPFSLKEKEIILTADYYATNSYNGQNIVGKLLFKVLRYTLTEYALLLYRRGFLLPVRTLERYDQFHELVDEIVIDIDDSDILWIDFSSLLPFFKNLNLDRGKQKLICNAHNIEYKQLERMVAIAKDSLERRWYKTQAQIMKVNELVGFAKCDLIITCSEIDKSTILFDLPNSHISTIPNGVNTDYFNPSPTPKLTNNPSLLFTGTMNYSPNKDAVMYFVTSIYPKILISIPECKFIVAGANASNIFKEYVNRDNIEIISSPEDMREIYDVAWVVVVPLRSGSGTRLKILEAMAMAKPIVSTPIGAEGIYLKNGKEIIIAKDEDDFAENICKLINNQKLNDFIKNSARSKVVKDYNWSTIRTNVSNTVLSIIE